MRKLKIGFIGAGGIAHVHAAQLLALPEAEIAAIADPNEEGALRFADHFGLREVQHYSSHTGMLKEGGLDAVLICSPHTQHFNQASDAPLPGPCCRRVQPIRIRVSSRPSSGEGKSLFPALMR